MKKNLLILLTFAVVGIVAIYIFIPGKIKIAATERGNTNPKAAQRYLADDANWEKWWPNSTPFYHNGFNFQLIKKMYNVFELQLLDKKDSLKTILQLVQGDKDSVSYLWTCELESSKNPIASFVPFILSLFISPSLFITPHCSSSPSSSSSSRPCPCKVAASHTSTVLATDRQADSQIDRQSFKLSCGE